MNAMPPQYDLSVVVPCLNEALNIPELVERLLHTFDAGRLRGELILVDDGSADDTPRVIRAAMRSHPHRVRGVFHALNQGLASAWRNGVAVAQAKVVAVMDGDLQYQPEDVLRLYRTLKEEHGTDIVQGWRSPVGRRRDARYYFSRVFSALLNGAFGMKLRDNKSGFVCCAKDVFRDLLADQGRYAYWQCFIMVAAHAKGYSYREIEIRFEPRKQGTSSLTGAGLRAPCHSLLELLKALWEYRIKRRLD